MSAFVVCGMAAADKLTGGGYTLYDSINSGGATLQGGGYVLKDAKGEVLGGQMTGGGYSFWPGLYGLFVGGVIEVPGVPYGTVPLYIRRNVTGNLKNIEITWEAKYVNPKIYATSGAGSGEYTSVYSAQWLPVTETGAVKTGLPVPWGTFKLAAGTTVLTHEAQLGLGTTECYYKGFQATIANPTTATDPETTLPIFPQAWAVGKVNMNLSGTVNLISMPFVPYNNSIDEVFAGQINNNGTLLAGYSNSTKAYSIYKYSGTYPTGQWGLTTGNAFPISAGAAYWVMGSPAGTITLIGSVETRTYTSTLTPGPNLFALPTPMKRATVDAANLLPAGHSGDLLARYNNKSKSYEMQISDGSVWKRTEPTNPPVYGLNPGWGFWYINTSKTNNVTYTLTLP
ncbi:MAG: hypothetical protein PHG97_01780 [Candidatus Margulisbacteria bacterium]|nr:hypothetical protein [Candidatus Margulisiibacteriota bacterium]